MPRQARRQTPPTLAAPIDLPPEPGVESESEDTGQGFAEEFEQEGGAPDGWDPMQGPPPSAGWGPQGLAEVDGQQFIDEEASIPIWAEFKQLQGTESFSLRVQRMSPQGTRDELGALEPDATQEMLLEHAIRLRVAAGELPNAAAGRYLVMPVSSNGKPMRAEPYSIRFPPDHPTIIAASQGRIDLRTPSALGQQGQFPGQYPQYGMPPSVAAGSPPVWDYLKARDLSEAEAEKARQAAIAAKEEAVRKAQEDLRLLMSQASNAHISAVTDTLTKAMDRQAGDAEKLREREAGLSKQIVEQASTGWMQMMTFMQQQAAADRDRAAAAEREREEKRRDHEKAMAEVRMMERQANERLFQLQMEALKAERERQAKFDAEQAEHRRAHDQAMLQLAIAQVHKDSPLGGLENLAKLKETMASLKEVMGGDEEGGGGFMHEVRSMVGDFMQASNERVKILAEANMLPDEGDEEPMQQAQIAGTTPKAIAPPAPDDGVVWPGQQVPQGVFVAGSTPAAPNVGPGLPQPPAPPPPDPVGMLPVEIRKGAKKLIRATVERLREAKPEEWPVIVQGGFMANPQIVLPYLQAATVRRALDDAGADQPMIESLIAGLKQSGYDKQVPLG